MFLLGVACLLPSVFDSWWCIVVACKSLCADCRSMFSLLVVVCLSLLAVCWLFDEVCCLVLLFAVCCLQLLLCCCCIVADVCMCVACFMVAVACAC